MSQNPQNPSGHPRIRLCEEYLTPFLLKIVKKYKNPEFYNLKAHKTAILSNQRAIQSPNVSNFPQSTSDCHRL